MVPAGCVSERSDARLREPRKTKRSRGVATGEKASSHANSGYADLAGTRRHMAVKSQPTSLPFVPRSAAVVATSLLGDQRRTVLSDRLTRRRTIQKGRELDDIDTG